MTKDIKVNGENFQRYLVETNKIRVLIKNIREDTAGSSFRSDAMKHPDFEKLIEMGPVIVPYIFHLITHEGSTWLYFMLLHRLTKQNPVPLHDDGSFIKTIIAWLNWYVASDYRLNDDIYHGLIKDE